MLNKLLKETKGITLIDLAILVMVLGLITAPLAQEYNNWRKDKIEDTTSGNSFDIDFAIEDFYFANSRYPCPAYPGLTPNSVNIPNATNPASYGEEYCTGNDDWDGTNDNTLVGEIPFTTLKIDNIDKTLDGWKNRMTYAVTIAHADSTSPIFDFDNAAPTVKVSRLFTKEHATTGNIVCDFLTSPEIIDARYTLLSHGESGAGALNVKGNQISACQSGSLTTIESENCNKDANFIHQQCMHNTQENSTFFNDTLTFKDEIPTRIWPPSTNDDAITEITRVGIGEDEPIFQLDIIGNMKTEENPDDTTNKPGNVYTEKLCTNDMNSSLQPTTCFKPELLTGNEPTMRCDNKSAMTGISRNKTDCNLTYFKNTNENCDKNTKYMIGLDANGVPICTKK